MLYVSRGLVLTVERQTGEDHDLLDRLMVELVRANHGAFTKVGEGRNLKGRKYIRLKYTSSTAADAAEKWIRKSFSIS